MLLRKLLYNLFLLVAVLLLLDALHAVAVGIGNRVWETAIDRGDDGVRAGCRAFSRGEGKTGLLLIHGFADSPAVYRYLANSLAERGFHCRAMRLPGHAQPLGEYADSTVEQWIAKTRAEIESLRSRTDEVWMVGHSMGAALALHLAREDPGLCTGLVLIAPLLDISGKRMLGLPAGPTFRVLDALTLFSGSVYNMLPLDLHADERRADYVRTRFIPLPQYRQMFRLLRANERQDPALSIPLLVFLASDDRIIDSAAARAYAKTCGAPRAAVVEPADTGHVLPWEYAEEAMAERIERFIHREANP